jgi:hypothetical protein
MRLTNVGGPTAGRLSVTVSKPPFGATGIIGASNAVDIAEGTSLGPGESATASLYCNVPKEPINSDPYVGAANWALNVDDPNFGHNVINFVCNAISEQYPPFYPNGTSLFHYQGCFKDQNPGRQLTINIYSSTTNTNQMCHSACYAAGYIYAGTEFTQECWCGNTLFVYHS